MALLRTNAPRNSGFPIIVGIVGHRDPAEPEKVAACIHDGLRQISERWPDSDIVGLSPLADGVDRLFARALLENGHRLRVVLPMPLEQYIQDFDPHSREEFDRLCLSAELITLAPPITAMTPDDDPQVAAYLAAGFYISQASHVLFAGWNGVVNGKQAGTAHIVHARLSGIYDRLPELDLTLQASDANRCPASHLTYLIRTERVENEHGHQALDMETESAWGLSPKMLGKAGQCPRLSDIPPIEALDNMVLIGQRLSLPGAQPSETNGLEILRRVRNAAEFNADRLLKRERAGLPILLLLGSLAVASFAIYGDFYDVIPGSWVLLVVYAVALALIAIVSKLQIRRLAVSDPTGWRRLSETLRVMIAWHQAGVGLHWNDLRPETQFRLTRHDDWVDCVIRGHLFGFQAPHGPKHGMRDLDALEAEWVDTQIAYFKGKDNQTARLNVLRRLGGVAFALGFLCVVSSGYFELTQTTGTPPSRILWFLAGIFPATGALLTGYVAVVDQTSSEADRRLIYLMFLELKTRIEAFRKNDDPSLSEAVRLRQSIISVGKTALAEVQNWSEITKESILKGQEFGR